MLSKSKGNNTEQGTTSETLESMSDKALLNGQLSSYFECEVLGVNGLLTVLDYEYRAGLSQLYNCKVNFVSLDPNLDYWTFVDKKAYFKVSIQGSSQLQYVNGIVSRFKQLGMIGDAYRYQLEIEPSLVQMQYQERTEIFLNKSIPEIIEWHLKQSKVQSYRLDLSQSYSLRAFVCQFQESDFNFISRWMEQEGIYYYFEQKEGIETLVLTDRYTTHKQHSHISSIAFNQKQVNQIIHSSNGIDLFSCDIEKVAQQVELKAYNYTDDTKDIKATALVSSRGVGTVDIYDENVLDEQEAKRKAKIRAEELASQEQIFHGRTMVPGMSPGFRFTLTNHFRASNNQEYLVYSIFQQGSQAAAALAHLGVHQYAETEGEGTLFSTEFKCIPSRVQYRAPRVTPIKRIDGIIPAIVDAETSGQYAQLDNQGRYKIRLLHSNKPDGQGSDWVRKMESYLGNQYGNHFPLHKHSEVCLSFEFGNPDRPVIMGAVHSSSKNNVVTSKNQKTSVTKSAGGNMMVMGDQEGQEYMHFYSPVGDTEVVYGHVDAANLQSKLGQKLKAHKDAKTKPWDVIDNTDITKTPSSYDNMGNTHIPKPPPINSSKWTTSTGNVFNWQNGDSYTVTNGKTYLYMDGAFEQVTNGPQYLINNGNTGSVTYGDDNSVLHGNHCGETHGQSTTKIHGNSTSMIMGGFESMVLGGKSFLSLGAVVSNICGSAVTTSNVFSALNVAYSKSPWTLEFHNSFSQTVTENISLKAGGAASIAAGGVAEIAAVGAVSIDAGEGMSITSADILSLKSSMLATISSAGNTVVNGTNVSVNGGNMIAITAATGITLTVGGASVAITDSGVDIVASSFTVNGVAMAIAG